MKTKINLKKTKLGLVSRVFVCFAIAMFYFNIASFSNSVKVHNDTDCTMQVYCNEVSLGTGVFYMGELHPGYNITVYPSANYGEVYAKNKRTGEYAKGLNFYYGNYDLHVDKGCQKEEEEDHPETPDNTPQCDDPTFNPCDNTNVLDFTQNGIDWDLNDMAGSYTVGEQTFDISIDDEDGIFAAFQGEQEDPDDEGSYENNTGIAVGINPHNTDDEIEINYNLSLVSDYVAFTIRDLDRKYYSGSQQIEEVCVYGYLDGVEILPTITPLCGSVKVNGNCAVGTEDSADGQDESIWVVFETCINEIVIVYGNASDAANDPTYSRIFIGDDIGFGTAVCTDECIPCTAEGSEVGTADSSVCLGEDGTVSIDESFVSLVNAGNGENSAWVVTNEFAEVLQVSAELPVVLDAVGNYKFWYVNWDGDLSAPLDPGTNAAEIAADSECVALGSPGNISVIECCTAENSVLELVGSDASICVDDDVDEPVDVQVTGGSGQNSAWVITDENNIIVDLPQNDPPFVLDGAGVGTCSIWYLNWDGDLAAMPMVGDNAEQLVTDSFCAKLSNPIAITRENCCTAENSVLELVGSDTSICVDDGVDEPIDVQVTGGSGQNSAWVITDENNIIVDLPQNDPPFVLDGAGAGTCSIWYLNWDGALAAMPMVGDNAEQLVTDSFCAKLSNPIAITRENCCTAENGVLELVGSSSICVDDDVDEPIDVQLTGGSGQNSAWVITDENNIIVDLPQSGPPFVLDAAGVGTCSIWYLTWDGALAAMPMVGDNAEQIANDSFCAKLSNPITITRENCCTAAPASIEFAGGGTTTDICVNEISLTAFNFNLVDPGTGESFAWVITDENNIIQSVSANPPSLELYNTPVGTMQIWYLNWDGDLSEAAIAGADAGQIAENSECAVLSNPVIIVKDCCCPNEIIFTLDNIICPAGNLIVRPIVREIESLLIQDENGADAVACPGVTFDFCSDDPDILDSTGSEAQSPITEAGEYTAVINCTCAPDVSFTITQQLIDDCAASAPIVSTPRVVEITETSASISYDYPRSVSIEYREAGDPDFISFESSIGMVFLTDLQACTTYEFRAKASDINGRTVVSELQNFTTNGCREVNINDINLRSLDVRSSSAILTWDNMSGCIYTLYYRVEGETEWHSYNTSIPFVALFGLNPCTNYEWALRVSDDEMVSDISNTQLISTTCQGPRLSNPSTSDVKVGSLTDIENIELELFINYITATLNINYLGLPVNGVEIYSANGQLVEKLNINNTGLNSIDVSSLDAGVYILVSNINGGLAKNKFVIN